jgi:hypothetical protein
MASILSFDVLLHVHGHGHAHVLFSFSFLHLRYVFSHNSKFEKLIPRIKTCRLLN